MKREKKQVKNGEMRRVRLMEKKEKGCTAENKLFRCWIFNGGGDSSIDYRERREEEEKG